MTTLLPRRLHVGSAHIQAASGFVRKVNGLKALDAPFPVDVAQGQGGPLTYIEQVHVFFRAGVVRAAVNHSAGPQGFGNVEGIVARRPEKWWKPCPPCPQ